MSVYLDSQFGIGAAFSLYQSLRSAVNTQIPEERKLNSLKIKILKGRRHLFSPALIYSCLIFLMNSKESIKK
jgi:hypothetical protein